MDFEVSTKYTQDEFDRFYRAQLWKMSMIMPSVIISFVILLAENIICFTIGGTELMFRIFPLTVGYIAFIVFFFWIRKKSSERERKSNGLTLDQVANYRFMQDGIRITGAGSENTINYDVLWRLLETDTRFYLMVSNYGGIIIRKDKCTKEQQDFIREKCVGRRKLKRKLKPTAAVEANKAVEDAKEDDQTEETPLYTVRTVYTMKECLKYDAMVAARTRELYILLGFFLAIFVIHSCLQDGIYGLKQALGFFVILILAVFCMLFLRSFLTYKKNPMVINREEEYRFYSDRIIATGVFGNTTIPYDKIYKMIENKNNIYIMVSKSRGIILCRGACPEELVLFLKEKVFNK